MGVMPGGSATPHKGDGAECDQHRDELNKFILSGQDGAWYTFAVALLENNLNAHAIRGGQEGFG